MSKIRVGDIVTLEMRVTSVASYASPEDPEGQQIQGKILPRGPELGWCVPQEVHFRLKEAKLKVGDEVYIDQAQSMRGTIIAMHMMPLSTADCIEFLWVREYGPNGTMHTVTLKDATRID